MEWTLALTSLLGVVALSHGRRWGWLVAIACSLGYAWFFWLIALPGQSLLNLIYALAQMWGWRQHAPFLTHRRAYLWLLPAVPLACLLQHYLSAADAWLTAAGLAAQMMTSLKIRQVWRCWVVIDLATAVLCASHSAWATALLYVMLAAVAESAHRTWLNPSSEEGAPT